MAANWEPVIEPSSELGVRAVALLNSITSEALVNPGLDAALLLAYRGVAERNVLWMRRAVEHLNAAIACADAFYSTGRFELFGGLAGLGWVVEHVTRQLNRFQGRPETGERAAGDRNADIDATLLLELRRGRWKGTSGLASGLTGLGLYFLESLPDPKAKFGLELVLAHLDAATPFAGVAAGAAGILYLAAETAAAGVGGSTAARLAVAAETAVLQRRTDAAISCAWWDGELGIAAACPGRQWTARLLDQCLRSGPDERLWDGSLPHGAAGAAHMWHRIYGRTGDPAHRAAALEWWESALASSQKATPAADAAGVRFLGGSAGVGLPLAAALTGLEPEWDRLMCLSSRR